MFSKEQQARIDELRALGEPEAEFFVLDETDCKYRDEDYPCIVVESLDTEALVESLEPGDTVVIKKITLPKRYWEESLKTLP